MMRRLCIAMCIAWIGCALCGFAQTDTTLIINTIGIKVDPISN